MSTLCEITTNMRQYNKHIQMQDKVLTASRSEDSERRISAASTTASEWSVGRFSLSRSRLTCTGKYPISMRRFSAETAVFCNPMDFKICQPQKYIRLQKDCDFASTTKQSKSLGDVASHAYNNSLKMLAE